MSVEKTADYGLTSRETYILGQALQIAITELEKVNEDWREDSNIKDMRALKIMFPFIGIEKKYNYKVVIDLEDNQKDTINMLKETIQKIGVKCKITAVQIF
jgi:hypothetical protein